MTKKGIRDYYTNSSSVFELKLSEAATAAAIVRKFEREVGDDIDFLIDVDSTAVYVCHNETINLELAADLFQALVDALDRAEPFVFTWAHTCSKPRIGAFGGGACVITKGCKPKFIDAEIEARKVAKTIRQTKQEVL